jgi:hypothetical protein
MVLQDSLSFTFTVLLLLRSNAMLCSWGLDRSRTCKVNTVSGRRRLIKFVASRTGSVSGDFGTASITFPKVGIRPRAGLVELAPTARWCRPTTNAYFGLQTSKSRALVSYDPGYPDYIRAFGVDVVGDTDWS